MERNPKCSVSTGRQRVMTKEMQGDPDESEFSIASVLRHAQRFDYEASFVCYTGTFSAVGFLPVVPGPCGLYRTDVLVPAKGYKGSPAEWYFDVVNTDPDKSGLILGNLRIAEDRVLSYSVVLKSDAPSEMGLVPQAVFYFEAETNLKSLVLQRRRWINGTWAGYWYLAIQHPDLIFKCTQLGFLKKIFVWFLLLAQLAIYFVVALAPSIFLGALRLTLSIISSDSEDSILAIAFWLLLVLLILGNTLGSIYFQLRHFCGQESVPIVPSCHKTYFTNHNWTDALTVWIILTILILPLVIAIIADGRKSIFLMLRSIIPYYLVLPMVVGFFAAYSFSRCWDLTWGNRPTEDDPAHRAAKQKEEDLKTQSATLAAFIAIANVFFFFAQVLVLNADGGKLYLSLAIFATTLLQMFIGLLWFSLYRFKYFFTSTYYWLRNCRHRKKFIYQTYGDEEDEEDKDIDVHTLYYDDNNDSDEESGDIADEDDFVDYYDPDSRAIVLVDGPLQRHMSVTAIALPPHLMAAHAKPPVVPNGARASPIHTNPAPAPSPAHLVIDTTATGGLAPSPRAGLPPSPRGIPSSSPRGIPSSPRSPPGSFLGSNTVFQPIIIPKAEPAHALQQYIVPLAPLVPSLRPKLARSTHSAYGVSFAPTPIVVSLNARLPTASNPNTPIIPPAPLANPATAQLKSRVRSTSMPQLPPAFFTDPSEIVEDLQSGGNNNSNNTATTVVPVPTTATPPRIAPPTAYTASPLKRSFNAHLN